MASSWRDPGANPAWSRHAKPTFRYRPAAHRSSSAAIACREPSIERFRGRMAPPNVRIQQRAAEGAFQSLPCRLRVGWGGEGTAKEGGAGGNLRRRRWSPPAFAGVKPEMRAMRFPPTVLQLSLSSPSRRNPKLTSLHPPLTPAGVRGRPNPSG